VEGFSTLFGMSGRRRIEGSSMARVSLTYVKVTPIAHKDIHQRALPYGNAAQEPAPLI
jgi:hypothetical protein